MAPGITQDQINDAADALLRAGERPTIERVSATLGTGLPNTLIRLLDVWWAALGERLVQQERRLAVPDAPAAFAEASGALWRMAIEHAEENATAAYASAQEELERSRQANDIAVKSAQAREQSAVDRRSIYHASPRLRAHRPAPSPHWRCNGLPSHGFATSMLAAILWLFRGKRTFC